MSAKVHLRTVRDANGYRRRIAVIDVPTHVGALRITGVGSWFGDALSSAAHVASSIVNNPIVKAVMPPQVAMAVNAVQSIANAAQGGVPALNAALNQFSGPGKQRLVSTLKDEAQKRAFGTSSRGSSVSVTPTPVAPVAPVAPAAAPVHAHDLVVADEDGFGDGFGGE